METTKTFKTVKVWRVSIQDTRNQLRWVISDYNRPYATFEEVLNSVTAWLKANPNRGIRFIEEQRTVAE